MFSVFYIYSLQILSYLLWALPFLHKFLNHFTDFVVSKWTIQYFICKGKICITGPEVGLIFSLFKTLFYFTTITKQVIQLTLIMLVGTDVCVRMVFVWEETLLSDFVTTWPSHMPTPGIKPGSHHLFCFLRLLKKDQYDLGSFDWRFQSLAE